MNNVAETSKNVITKAKEAGLKVYAKGNACMDRVPALKEPARKKCVWGIVAAVVLLFVGSLFCGGSSGSNQIVKGCKAFIEHQYGAGSLQAFDVVSLEANEGRAILKADVKIHAEPSMDPVSDGFDAVGTAVFYLQEEDGDVSIVNFELQ